ncbi:GNAT family N-acetyltransferase [Intrasporangium calvum]|uniref:GNAT family N-acetyltransferase n=1 Tax=Intrasporangium calvum TaxID=53358 RepID=A0ABT5GH17_9MICO|nr:GNAT family N-acetyltransferase [Intrasporangium calvum]MDC5697170.1 GNAT family N-acetyltransferase [Intrasporangium calvum]
MADVVVRRAGADDAFIVAALHLQFARELGLPSEPGYLDRFVDAWLGERPDRPTWIAEARSLHAGILETRRIRALPWPGRKDVSWLHVGGLYVIPDCRDLGVARALTETMIEWSRSTDVKWIRVNAPDEQEQQFYERLGFDSPGRLMEFDLRDPE